MNCSLCKLTINKTTGSYGYGWILFSHCQICAFCKGRLDLNHAQPLKMSTSAKLESNFQDYRLISRFKHQDLPQKLLSNFKYKRNILQGQILTKALEHLLVQSYADHARPDAIVTIPATTQRFLERGFCHTELMAAWLSQSMNLPRWPLLRRVGKPKQQAGLNRTERLINIKDSFALGNHPVPELSHVALLDDVITTGATVSEAIKTLELSGRVARIDIWSLTRRL